MDSILKMGVFRDKVLVVEDEFINREILGHILEGSYDVTLAENGREAIEIVAKSKVPFSLILLDLLMPDMDYTPLMDTVLAKYAELKEML